MLSSSTVVAAIPVAATSTGGASAIWAASSVSIIVAISSAGVQLVSSSSGDCLTGRALCCIDGVSIDGCSWCFVISVGIRDNGGSRDGQANRSLIALSFISPSAVIMVYCASRASCLSLWAIKWAKALPMSEHRYSMVNSHPPQVQYVVLLGDMMCY